MPSRNVLPGSATRWIAGTTIPVVVSAAHFDYDVEILADGSSKERVVLRQGYWCTNCGESVNILATGHLVDREYMCHGEPDRVDLLKVLNFVPDNKHMEILTDETVWGNSTNPRHRA